MATHSSVLAWRIPGMGSLVGCSLWGRTESDTTEAMQQQHTMPDTVLGTRQIKPLFSRSSHSDGLVYEYRAGGRIVVQLLSHVSL